MLRMISLGLNRAGICKTCKDFLFRAKGFWHPAFLHVIHSREINKLDSENRRISMPHYGLKIEFIRALKHQSKRTYAPQCS